MEHISLYKDGNITFNYDEPEPLCTPVQSESVFQYLQDTVRLERSYTIRDLVKLLDSYPELARVHSFTEDLIDIINNIGYSITPLDINYLSFECIHDMYYHNQKITDTQTYTHIDVYSGNNNDLCTSILDYTMMDIIDIPIVIRSGVEYDDDLERIYIDNVSFLNFTYELIDYLSYINISAFTNIK